MTAPSENASKDRLIALDVLRGLAVAGMLFVEKGVPVTQLTHTQWQGAHLADFVYPLFLFTSGIAASISWARSQENITPPAARKRTLYRRACNLYLIGVLLVIGSTGGGDAALGTLQDIAIISLLTIPHLGASNRFIGALAAFFLALVHAVSILAYPHADLHGPWEKGGTVSELFDVQIVGSAHGIEGLLPTLALTFLMLAGVIVGRSYRAGSLPGQRALLLFSSVFALTAALISSEWSPSLLYNPVIPHIASASFVLYGAAWCMALFAAVDALADRAPGSLPIRLVAMVGENALAAYVGVKILFRWVIARVPIPSSPVHRSALAALQDAVRAHFGEAAAGILPALIKVGIAVAITCWLKRRGLRIKL